MNAERRRTRDRQLRALLKLGDPARDDATLPPTVVARMRRNTLAAAEGRNRRTVRRLVPIAGAVVVVLTIIWLFTGEPDRPTEPAPIAPVTEPRADVARTLPALPTPAPEQPKPVKATSVRRSEQRKAPAARATVAAALEREARTIRFVTQSGTQIIWTLDPSLDI